MFTIIGTDHRRVVKSKNIEVVLYDVLLNVLFDDQCRDAGFECLFYYDITARKTLKCHHTVNVIRFYVLM